MEFISRNSITELSNPGVISRQLLNPDNSDSKRVTITEVHLQPGAIQPRHTHDASEQIWYALQGSGQLLLEEGKEISFHAGDVVRFAETDVHGLRNDGGSEFIYLSVTAPPIHFGYAYDHETVPKQLEDQGMNVALYEKDALSILDVIMSRHSYRGRYKPDRVPQADLRTIMEAGLAAPSGCNKQTTSIIAVDDSELLDKIRQVIDPPVAETAPAMICVLTQRINVYRDRCYATQDYAAAIENMLLAANALGYRSCWYEGHITDTDRICDKIAKILNVPEEYELVCILPVGIAETEAVAPKKKRFDERAWFNEFQKDAE